MNAKKRSPLEAAMSSVARRYSSELVAAAKCIAESAPNDQTFTRAWLGIGELARMGALDLDASTVGAPFTTAPDSARTYEE